MKLNLKNKKIMIIGIVLIILLIGVLVIVAINSNTGAKTKKNYEKIVRELGKEFYENHYYDLVVKSNGIDYVKSYSDAGLTITLDSIESMSISAKKKAEKIHNEEHDCGKSSTKVVIHPKDPYGKGDYDMDIILDCGFEN